jgi:glutamate racemase
MKIGVFDSGKGGLNILRSLRARFRQHHFVYACDTEHMPYGSKSPAEINRLVGKAIQPLIESCQIIVLACNTATTVAIDNLRRQHPDIKFIGLEPMVRPAASLTKNGVIAVCATPATLRSPNYQKLKTAHAAGVKVLEPDCSQWAELVETGRKHQIDLRRTAQQLAEQNCDVIVLGCTHYHSLKPALRRLLPRVKILEPSDAIAERLDSLI